MKTAQLILAATVATTGLCLSTTTFAQQPVKPALHSTKKPPMELLFVIDATDTVLTHFKKREYRLIVPLKNISPALVFSDRPYRVAWRLPYSRYTQLVHHSSDPFSKDKPNIVVHMPGHPSMPFTLIKHTIQKQQAIYQLRLMTGKTDVPPQTHIRGNAVIIIDGIHCQKACPPHVIIPPSNNAATQAIQRSIEQGNLNSATQTQGVTVIYEQGEKPQ